MSKKLKSVITLGLSTEGLETFFHLQERPELEDFYRELAKAEHGPNEADYTEVSNKWFDDKGNGLKFYKNTKQFIEYVKKFVEGKYLSEGGSEYLQITNAFGKGLFDESKANVAILRIVGSSNPKGVNMRTTDLIAEEEFDLYAKQLALFVKEFYGSFIRKRSYKAIIQFELK